MPAGALFRRLWIQHLPPAGAPRHPWRPNGILPAQQRSAGGAACPARPRPAEGEDCCRRRCCWQPPQLPCAAINTACTRPCSLSCLQVLILDWDVHHGNGSQDCFYGDPSVLFIDLHQAGVWPGSGALHETGAGGLGRGGCLRHWGGGGVGGQAAGWQALQLVCSPGACMPPLPLSQRLTRVAAAGAGAGAGATLNVPLPWYSGHAAAQRVFEAVVAPAARRFKPDIILVSAGDSLPPACVGGCSAA